jgi:hypothetical protein
MTHLITASLKTKHHNRNPKGKGRGKEEVLKETSKNETSAYKKNKKKGINNNKIHRRVKKGARHTRGQRFELTNQQN